MFQVVVETKNHLNAVMPRENQMDQSIIRVCRISKKYDPIERLQPPTLVENASPDMYQTYYLLSPDENRLR